MVPYSATMPIPKLPMRVCKSKGRGKPDVITDSVITFDTEATTFFQVDGMWKSEKYTTLEERKRATDTLGIIYIWMCRMKGLTVYGRTKSDLAHFLSRLDQINPALKIFWVHNLNYDYSFLSDLMEPDPIAKKAMVARAKMSPLRIKTFGYNIELRDSYALCNMSLAKVGESYHCGRKLKGQLDYTEQRLPNTPLTLEELEYCEADVDVLYDYIYNEWYTEYNGDFLAMPLTQTGVPRRAVKKLLSDKKHMKNMKAIMPKTLDEYNLLHEPFAGGVAHANYIYSSYDCDSPRVIKNVTSADRASSYPAEIVSRKYPCSKFVKMKNPDDMDIYADNKVYILTAKFTGLKQRCAWDYISYSKCHEPPVNAVVDNGRVASADELVIKITNIDLRIINNVYDYDELKIIDAYVAKADYLPKEFVLYTLELYGNKTKLKKSNPALYLRSKQILNSLFGMLCTDICREEVEFIDGLWKCEYEQFVKDGVVNETALNLTMEEKLKHANPFLPYSVGVFITAYAREQLFDPIIHYDPDTDSMVGIANDAVYTDTDSVKYVNGDENRKYIDDYNRRMLERLHAVAKARNIPYELFAPLDPDGNPHPLGVFEDDGFYDEFVTMGAKKYCFRKKQDDGSMKFNFTVAGLQKTYVDANGEHKTMKSLEEMTPGTKIDNGRTNYTYSVSQQLVELTDYLGNTYINDYERGVSMWRTPYTFSLSDDYANLLNDDMLDVWEQKHFNKISSPLAQVAQWRKDGTNG